MLNFQYINNVFSICLHRFSKSTSTTKTKHIVYFFLYLEVSPCNLLHSERRQGFELRAGTYVLFWAPVQVLESRNESGEQQNLGQGLQVFKCTIGALMRGQEEFKKMVCRLLKHLKRENVANLSTNRTISVLTKLQLLETNKTIQGLTRLHLQNHKT